MTSRLCFAACLLASLAVTACLPATAQNGTQNLPPAAPLRPTLFPALPPLPSTPLVSPPIPVLLPKARRPAKPIVPAELIERLRTANFSERREIIQQLSDSQQKIVPLLIKALSDPDPLVKSGVAEALGNRPNEAIPAIPGLVAMVSDPRRAIVPTPSFPTIPLPSISLPSPPSFSNTVLREPPIAPENPDNLLRITAVVAIGKIGLPARASAMVPISQALQDTDPWVRLNATWALAETGAQVPLLPHWLEALQSPIAQLRHSAANVFLDSRSLLPKALGSDADAGTASRLIPSLKDDDFTVRAAAGHALELLGTGALPALLQALKAPEPVVRLESARVIGNLGAAAQSAVPNLLPLLNDSGQYVPPMSDRDNFLLLLPPLQLSSVNYPAFPPDNPEQLVRVNAAIALGKLGDRRTVPALTTALSDKNPWMQLATGWALLVLGQNQGLPVVGRLLQYPDDAVQAAALSQLDGYGSQAAPYVLPYYATRLDQKDDNQRDEAVIGVGRFGVAALGLVPKLRTLLTRNQKNTAGYTATVLGQIAEATAVAWGNGSLLPDQRNQAIAEFSKVLATMQAPGARFNRPPIDRVRNALVTLKGAKPG